jgi:hypothetical protein
VLSKGGWTFTPRPASTPEASAFLCFRGDRIELLYTSTAFERFLAEMGEIEQEFERLWPGGSTVVRHGDWRGDWAGQTRHA